jgi:hypothetical protein
MRRIAMLVGLLVAFGLGVACSSSEAAAPERVPDDFGGTLTYRNGTVPPPYHYEWTLEVTGTDAVIRWRPGYDDSVEPWVTTVPLGAAGREKLYAGLRNAGAFSDFDDETDEGLAGGSTGRIMFTVAERKYESSLGHNKDSGRLLGDLHDAVTAAIPESVWQEFDRKQTEWGKTVE